MACRGLMICFFLSFSVVVGGCRRAATFVPIEGTVTKAGQPLAGVQLLFYPDLESDTGGPISRGSTDANGHYRLKADSGDDGAVAGKYRVCVVTQWPSREEVLARQPGRKPAESSKAVEATGLTMRQAATQPKLPAAYTKFQETPLRAEVRPGGLQTLDFDIPEK